MSLRQGEDPARLQDWLLVNEHILSEYGGIDRAGRPIVARLECIRRDESEAAYEGYSNVALFPLVCRSR